MVKVVTWNMALATRGNLTKHDEAWHFVFEVLKPDIFLGQECRPPAWVRESRQVVWTEARQDLNWGSAVVASTDFALGSPRDVSAAWMGGLALPPDSYERSRSEVWLNGEAGWVSAVDAELPDGGPALIVSVHNPSQPLARESYAQLDVSGVKLEHNPRMWLLDVLFFQLRSELDAGRRFIVGGDFNYSRLLDLPPRGNHGNNEFFDRLGREGFVSLHRKFRTHDDQTFFRRGQRAHQLDYLYSDPDTGNRCANSKVVDYNLVATWSDHAPLLAAFTFH